MMDRSWALAGGDAGKDLLHHILDIRRIPDALPEVSNEPLPQGSRLARERLIRAWIIVIVGHPPLLLHDCFNFATAVSSYRTQDTGKPSHPAARTD
jgi:hypothetical protein